MHLFHWSFLMLESIPLKTETYLCCWIIDNTIRSDIIILMTVLTHIKGVKWDWSGFKNSSIIFMWHLQMLVLRSVLWAYYPSCNNTSESCIFCDLCCHTMTVSPSLNMTSSSSYYTLRNVKRRILHNWFNWRFIESVSRLQKIKKDDLLHKSQHIK